MEFFDKKQDVIDIQITQFGRHLMSKGMFKPAYYSFFDDNVLYNSARAGIEEEQNSSHERIREAQTLQPQIAFSSLDREFKNNYDFMISEEKTAFSSPLQRTPEKNYLLPMPLGASSINSDIPPSWDVKFLKGEISSSAENLEVLDAHGGKHMLSIPQLECSIEIQVDNTETVGDMIMEEVESDFAILDGAIISDKGDLYIVIKALENNGDYQKKNFDMEMFEIIEDIENGVKTETLRPLSFDPKTLSHGAAPDYAQDVPKLDKSYAGYYVDIKVDDEIKDEILCELDPADERRGVFADAREKTCRDLLDQDKKVIEDIYIDEEDYPGEVC